MNKKIVLYTTSLCPYCTSAKKMLDKKNVLYSEINVDGDSVKMEWVLRLTAQKTFPQLFVNNEPVGGFSDMQDLEKKNQLNQILGIKTEPKKIQKFKKKPKKPV